MPPLSEENPRRVFYGNKGQKSPEIVLADGVKKNKRVRSVKKVHVGSSEQKVDVFFF